MNLQDAASAPSPGLAGAGAGRGAALERHGGVAVWRQLGNQLRSEIRARRYATDGRLPSEQRLAERFGVNRHTVRQALAALQSEGLVRIEQGRGAFIEQRVVDYALRRRTRYSENILRNRLLPGTRLLSAAALPADARTARALGLRKGRRVLRVVLLDEADGAPVALSVMHFPAARFPGLLALLAGDPRVSEVLRQLGVGDYLRASNRITAVMPDEETAQLLRQPRTRPLLCVESVDVDPAGVPIKHGETLFAGDRVQLNVDPGAP